MDNIKHSKSFKAVRSITSKIEKIRKKKEIIKDIEATVSASKKTIETEGLGSFVNHAKSRIKRKELLLRSKTHEVSPIHLTQKEQFETPYFQDLATKEQIFEQKFNASVVIPTNSKENSLRVLIDNIKSQQGFKTLQIILVNS